MGFHRGKKIVTNGLKVLLDAGNVKSYIGSGTSWNDLTNNNNDGVLVGGPTFDGGTIVFDGVNNYIQLPSFTMLRIGGSISSWINISDFTTGKTSTGRVFIRDIGNNGNNLITFYNGGYTFETTTNSNPHETSGRITGNVTSTLISPNNWFHFSLIFNDNSFYGYINGKPLGNGALANNLTFNSIGNGSGFSTAYPAYFKGKIANLMVYDRALTLLEVNQNYETTKNRFN